MKEQLIQYATSAGKVALSYADNVLFAALILILGGIVIKVLSGLLRKAITRADGRHALVVRFVVSAAEKTGWAFLFVMALEKLGVDVAPIIAGLGVTGFVIGFACQESLASLAAGLMIALNEPFKVGDYVVVAGFEGSITALDMMAVTLATADNRKITIPNKSAWGQPIVNFSALDKRRVDISVGIAYGADISLAKRTALEAIKAIPGVLADPAPMCEITSLGDSAVALTVRGWSKNADYWSVYFAGIQSVKESFDRAGVAIPFPQVDVHMVKSEA